MNPVAKTLVIGLALLLPVAAVNAGAAEKAPTAKTIKVADVYKDKDSLDNKKVTVKGKVVKVAAEIMGKNWIHLQDGSGDPAKKNNDITITTNDPLPEKGKTVTITGTVHKNKDFGSGYFYPVIIEEATVGK